MLFTGCPISLREMAGMRGDLFCISEHLEYMEWV